MSVWYITKIASGDLPAKRHYCKMGDRLNLSGNDDGLVFEGESQQKKGVDPWKVMVADDDPQVHQVAKLALEGFTFAGKSLNLISAYSGKQAKRLIKAHPDTTLILLDAVMETKDAGLKVAQYIRKVLKNQSVRIILQTEQSREIPEAAAILDWDINDCKTKLELTQQKLLIAIIAGLRSYRNAIAAQNSRQNLEQLAEKNRQLQEEIRTLRSSQKAFKQIEEELRESEERWQLVLRGNNDGIWDWNIKTNQAFLSPRWKEMLGYQEYELGNDHQTWRNLIHPDDCDWVIENLQNHLERKTPYCYTEYRLRCKDGSYKWILSRGQALWDEQGNPVRMVGSNTDITDRKRVEEELRQSEEGFRTLVANIPGAVYRCACDSDWTMEFISEAIEEITGYPASDYIYNQTRSLASIIHPEDRERVEKIVNQALVQRQPYILEYRIIHANGSIRWVYEKGQGIFDPGGKLLWLDGAIFDITERKQAEEALKREQTLLRSLIDNIPDCIFYKDANGVYQAGNSALEELVGRKKTEIIGLTDFELFPQDLADFFREQDRLVMVQGKPRRNEEWVEYPDGQRRLLDTLKTPLVSAEGTLMGIIGISRDITERKQQEEALRLIVEGTAAKTGSNFFRSCTRYLAEVLQVRYALFTEFANQAKRRVRTLAFWQGGGFGENFEYDLNITSSDRVLEGKKCYYSESTEALFREDPDLAKLNAQSYLGIPLADSAGNVLGYLAVLDVKPIVKDGGKELILKIFAARAGAELERKLAEEALEKQAEKDSLLSSISRQFIDQDIDTAINFTLQALGKFTKSDRSCIFSYCDRNQFGMTHEWCNDGIESFIANRQKVSVEAHPWFHKKLLRGKPFQIENIAELPPEAAADKREFERQSIQSLLNVPMINASKTVGYLGLDAVRSSKVWTQEDVNLLKLVGEMIAIAQARQEAEEALREAKARFAGILDNANEAIISVDENQRITLFNQGAESIFGYTAQEILGQPFDLLLPSRFTDIHRQHIDDFGKAPEKARKMGGRLPVFGCRKDGTEFMAEVSISKLQLGDRQVLTAIVRDITERKQAEAALCRSNALLKAQQEAAPDGILVVDENHRIVSYNQRYCELTQVPNALIMSGDGQHLLNWVLGKMERPQEFLSQVNYLYEHPTEISRDEIVLKDGRIFERYSAPVQSSEGDYYGRIWSFRDITDRKQAETKLREITSLQQAILDGANYTITSTDTNGVILAFNAAAERMLGYSADEVIGKVTPEIIHDPGELVERSRSLCAELGTTIEPGFEVFVAKARQGIADENEWSYIRKDGSRFPVLLSVTALRDCQGNITGFLGIASDITERKQAESELRRAKETADAANRAKSEFLASMSHELRTPLNAILGFTQVMNRDPSLSKEQQQNLGIISRSGEHLLDLINDILEMSKIEAGRTIFNENSFDLYRLLDSLEEMLRLKADAKGLQLIFERTPDVPQYVQTDEGKLRQVLINLLGNAIKFTEEGGVTLRVRREQGSRGAGGTRREGDGETGRRGDGENFSNNKQQTTNNKQPTTNNKQQTTIHFEIEDTGPGIAPEEVDKLFEAFGQTETGRKSQQGTGLGLPISQKFVQLMGGNITVSSILGSGTMFGFDIQVSLAQASDIQTTQTTRKVIGLAPDQPKYRILAVDDRLESRLLLVKLLSSMGFSVREAANGQEAIEQWESWEPHLIWMDMQMPVMNGYQATKKIKATIKGQATVIIALTASAFEEERTIVLDAGCNDFMRKPFREEMLWEKMAEHLGVRYLYQESEENSQSTIDNQQSNIEQPLDVHLSQMPTEWMTQLHQAACECSDDLIFELIEQIPQENIPLAIALKDLAENFLFDKIMELTKVTGE